MPRNIFIHMSAVVHKIKRVEVGFIQKWPTTVTMTLVTESNNPNFNYEILHSTITQGLDKYMTLYKCTIVTCGT